MYITIDNRIVHSRFEAKKMSSDDIYLLMVCLCKSI